VPESPSSDGSVTARRCLTCQQPLSDGRTDRRFCSATCRQTAYRRRRSGTTDQLPAPLGRSRRENTIYACGECDQRYLAEQWCPDCNRPCRRVGPGGRCPSCDEPVTVEDLLTEPPLT
jgi:hypothetical protein